MTEIRLSDYQPPSHLIEKAELTFRLHPTRTRVLSRLHLAPNIARPGKHDLRLDGENLQLISCNINNMPVSVVPDETGLTLPAATLPDGPFIFEAEVEIAPEGNTALEGLYMSNGMYCTQCEAEGFRKITYYPDRPDVMAPFDVRIESDLPVLLSNGNPLTNGDNFAEWSDPWPKPSYLFALVAGDLIAHSDSFTTASGKAVELNIWVRPGDENKCAYAMDSLKRSMRWDETAYGREYDLDIFNIVAVDDFNMGAMENKGLNIFNSKYVLALPETATDEDFARIEAIIAHEYFHNWTGNRITCRDWFQLCLKEGLTVFRDQQFSADMRSAPVKRIEDVLTLRARQFREDNGPLAHAVRPDHYAEINNFYTATVYEKGAEVIGMLKRLVGDADYDRALNLYFDRHDGQAATIEDWLKVFEDSTGRDLSAFKRWYTEAGTPRVKVSDDWKDGTYALTFEQVNSPTPGQPDKQPKVIPISVGLLNPNGDEVLPTTTVEMTDLSQTFVFKGLASRPVPSILRGFSAPVILERASTPEERAFLLAHDTDPFNKWEAGRALAKDVLAGMITKDAQPGPHWLDALARVAEDESLDPAFRALALRLPGEDDMAQTLFDANVTPDPDRIHAARRRMAEALAKRLAPALPRLIEGLAEPGPFTPEARAAGRRSLRLSLLGLVSRMDSGARAEAAFRAADNMTEQLGALACLLDVGRGQPELAAFEAQWRDDRLVMDKWFALQIGYADPQVAVTTTENLTGHPLFDWKNPNRFRSVIGTISANHAGFHRADGAGYKLVADWLIRLDPLNPQTAARMSTAFETWGRYDADRQDLMTTELRRISASPGLSRDLREMTARMLGTEV
ncbi:MAG: aminopeptidase N [Cereibacter sphaeroides]|uniref:Aminopeptidase N n=1 Tax=Cereibacter sphaeroides TaxID=1063 RepID=A0A2W5TMC7_CERSP|nr:MAG: aminopeptidase N [Cereibacter sphaeroides]